MKLIYIAGPFRADSADPHELREWLAATGE